jgi:biofilm protein TabA
MKQLLIYKKTVLLFALTCLTGVVLAQDTTKNLQTEKSVTKWLHKNEWKNGLKLDVYKDVNKMEFAKQYHGNKPGWDKAFAFLRDSDLLKLKPGKYIIDGDNVYATITEAPEKTFEQTTWESHRKYTDLQYVIKGKEKIGVAQASTATVTKPYDESKDAANYTAEGKYYVAESGTFYLFFPQDAHRPNIKVDGYDVVKKIVIKVRVSE